MSENSLRGAGIFAREIDLAQPQGGGPSGVPAAVIGTSRTGPAFVPITVGNIREFVARFGDIDSTKFGAMALREWMDNRSAGTFLRVLGAGDGKKRATSGNNTGKVTNAGFVVGQRLPQENGNVGNNPYTLGRMHLFPGNNPLGRTYVLGCFMSESSDNSNKIFSKAGIGDHGSVSKDERTKPIIRGILMAPSGVLLTLSSSVWLDNSLAVTSTPGQPAGGPTGDVAKVSPSTNDDPAVNNFVMYLNNFKENASYSSIITASFDPQSDGYFVNHFNRDPSKIEQAGHLLYSHFNIYNAQAAITGAQSRLKTTDWTPSGRELAFLVTSSNARNSGSALKATKNRGGTGAVGFAGIPNFEGFEDRFARAQSPWITSQDMGNGPKNLFKIHALADGGGFDPGTDVAKDDLLPNQIKISIQNIKAIAPASRTPGNEYGSFDLLVRKIDDDDKEPNVFERFSNINLDPGSDRFIGRVIGDMYAYFDFEKATRAQKIAVKGRYPVRSQYIRVEIDGDVQEGRTAMDPTVLPIGFRGPAHMVTSGSDIIQARIAGGGATSAVQNADTLREITQPPVPFRWHIGIGAEDTLNFKPDFDFYWGVQFTRKSILNQPNGDTTFEDSIYSWTKYYPTYNTNYTNPVVGDNAGEASQGGTVLDSDLFGNNRFTLERVQVVTSSVEGALDIADLTEAQSFRYRRDATVGDSATTELKLKDGSKQVGRFLNVDKDFPKASNVTKLLKFSVFLQGGFDGTNIFNKDKMDLTDAAVRREYDDSTNQGGVASGPTIQAYRKATDVLAEHANVDIQLLAIPGLRHPSVTDYAIDAMEDRFDAMYIMDIETKDNTNSFITGSGAVADVGYTADRMASRDLNSSFAAAYFPDVLLSDRGTGTNVVPASVGALGVFGLSDALGFPWFAPAGYTRGVVKNALRSTLTLTRDDNNALAAVDVNPLIDVVGQGTLVYGQRTLFKAQSALDRVNVRRLLIDIRRQVKKVANTILFEPNRDETLARFSSAVDPILATIQQQQGVERYRVQIDTTTTTQADIENNTIRGKIFLQPTKSVDFIELDFVVSNTIDTGA